MFKNSIFSQLKFNEIWLKNQINFFSIKNLIKKNAAKIFNN